MTGNWARARARERIEDIAAVSVDARNLRIEALTAIREVIGFDAYVWLLTDPATAVGAAPLAEVPCMKELPSLIKAKYATPLNRWTVLPQSAPVALLHAATHGDLAQSGLWRDVLSRYAIADVASAVFADQFGCWGFLDLWRDDTSQPFSSADAEFVASVLPPLTAALRRCQAYTFIAPSSPQRGQVGPIVLTLNDDLSIASRTAASQAWLDALLPPDPAERAIPASVYNVAAQLLATEQGIDAHPASARTHLADGFWLTLRAARLSADERERDGPASGAATLVVTIEEASAAERTDLFSRAHGLSGREHEVLDLLAAGSDTRTMARQMSLSEHTIQDHLKAVFFKTGAHDRVTLLSRALGTRRGAPDEA